MDVRRGDSRRRPVRSRAGMTLLELMIAASVLVMASLSLAYAFSSSGLVSQQSDRALNVRGALTSAQEALADVPYEQLMAWDGQVVQTGPDEKLYTADDADLTHPGVLITTAVSMVQVGLVLVEYTASDADTGVVLSRAATYRSGEY